MLAQIVDDAGFHDTAQTIAEAIRLQAHEVPLTVEDHEAILTALGSNCPGGLGRLRRELLEQQRLRRRF
jgi:hypothetical protein